MDSILIGYCAKQIAERPEWLDAEAVEEICSVSNCISSGPEGSTEFSPDRNPLWLYPSAHAAAASIKPPDDPGDFDIFAYKLLPLVFGDEGEQLDLDEDGERPAVETASRTVEPLPSGFELLGYDCPNKAADWPYSGFNCSPLSCNSMANTIPVNQFCLLESRDDALAAASQFGKQQPEPGCYYVVEVWRQTRDRPSP